MRMATSFLGLTTVVEQQRAYATKARAEARAELEMAGRAKGATRTSKAWRVCRDANIASKTSGKPLMAQDQREPRKH